MFVSIHRTMMAIPAGLLLPFIVFLLISTMNKIPYVLNMDMSYPMVSTRRNSSKEELTYRNEMPDLCAIPRRNTGVEDLLCMKPPIFLKRYKNPCWIDNGTFLCLPYFYLFGNSKCGTTDFFKRINLHPDIILNKGYLHKETSFWSRSRLRLRKSQGTLGPLKTFRQFTDIFRGPEIRKSANINGYHYKITCLGDPMDFYDRFDEENLPVNIPGAEELLCTTPYVIKHIQPDVKLLLILRDPINRLYSHYFHGRFGTSAKTFHNHTLQSIKVLNDCFGHHSVRHCLFSKSISQQLKIFSALVQDGQTCDLSIYKFVAMPLHIAAEGICCLASTDIFMAINFNYAHFLAPRDQFPPKVSPTAVPNECVLNRMSSMPHYRVTKGKMKAGPMLPETKTMLIDFFKPYINELAKFLQNDRYLFRDTNFGSITGV